MPKVVSTIIRDGRKMCPHELNHSAVANLELAIFARHPSGLFPGLDNFMFRSHNLLIGPFGGEDYTLN